MSRSRNRSQPRARTISGRVGKRSLPMLDRTPREADVPRTRADCIDGPRPCPYVACEYHLYVDVSPRTGAMKLNFPHLDVLEMGESCTLDVAERGATLEEVGNHMNLTKERVRQIEIRALTAMGETIQAGESINGR